MHIVSSCSVYSIILWCKLYVLWCIFYNIEMYIYCIYCDVYLDPVHTGLYMGEIFFLEYICGVFMATLFHGFIFILNIIYWPDYHCIHEDAFHCDCVHVCIVGHEGRTPILYIIVWIGGGRWIRGNPIFKKCCWIWIFN